MSNVDVVLCAAAVCGCVRKWRARSVLSRGWEAMGVGRRHWRDEGMLSGLPHKAL